MKVTFEEKNNRFLNEIFDFRSAINQRGKKYIKYQIFTSTNKQERYDNLNLQHLSTTCKQTSEERYIFSIESVQHPDT